jgi:RimJ/RimL family protein N-acetyltransferase
VSLQYAWAGPEAPDDHAAISKWVSQHSFGHPGNVWPDSTALGILLDGKPIAGFIIHDYKPAAGTVQLSGASTNRRWATGPTLHYLYSYMFDTLGCRMVTTGNSGENKHLHRLLEKLGHRKYVIHDAWDNGVDMIFWTLTRAQWEANDIMRRSRRWAEEIRNVESTGPHASR